MNEQYFNLMKEKSEWFENLPNGIEILTDKEDIARVEEENKTVIGVIYEDEYIVFLKDAVRFADGMTGTYIRIYHKNEGGVAILIFCGDKILLLNHFRHSLRKWVWETPRGFGEKNQSPIENALRETNEELGVQPYNVELLGEIAPDAGVFGNTVTLFKANVPNECNINFEVHEGIGGFRLFSKSEVKEAIVSGEIVDGITIASIALAEYKGII